MNPNMNQNQNYYNFATGEYDDESWREEFGDELQLPPSLDFTSEDIDLTYRSIRDHQQYQYNEVQTSSASSSQFFDPNIQIHSHKDGNIGMRNENSSFEIQEIKEIKYYENLKVPSIPFYVGFSNFTLRMILNELVVSVQNCLDQIIELDYSFIETSCKWDIVYLRGSSYCHFEISVFDDNSAPDKYLLEGNRLSGDSLSFRLIFNQIKDVLTVPKFRQIHPITPYLQTLPVPSTSSMTESTAAVAPPPKLSHRSINIPSTSAGTGTTTSNAKSLHSNIDEDEQIRKYLQPILAMIEPSSPVDIQLEGIRILCDFTMTIDLHRILVECNCVEKLIDLLTTSKTHFNFHEEVQKDVHFINEDNCCHQYALYAISNMSTYRPCQNILVSNDQFLAYLMAHITNGSHVTAEMRRECARTLANICVGLAPKIVRNLGLPMTMKWVETVDSLSDERLKLHATRAKMYIQNCF